MDKSIPFGNQSKSLKGFTNLPEVYWGVVLGFISLSKQWLNDELCEKCISFSHEHC